MLDLRRLAAASLFVGLIAPSSAGSAPAQTEDELRADVAVLTGPGTEGRAVGSPGAALARRYLISELEALGAAPLPDARELGLPFGFLAQVDDLGSSLTAGGHKRFGGDQVRAFAFSETGEARGELLFAGFGIRVPENSEVRYDSYAGQDVRDRVAVVLEGAPAEAEDGTLATLRRHASLRAKAAAARDRGAAGLVVLSEREAFDPEDRTAPGFDIAAPGSQGVVTVRIDRAAGERLLAGSGLTLEGARRELDRGDPGEARLLPGFATLTVSLDRVRASGANVAALLPAADGRLAPPWIAIGAHYDHLGMGGASSLNPHGGAPAVHPGADDNASGTAAVLAVARAVAASPLDRPLLVAFWSGEESGLLGSNAFVSDRIRPEDVAAYVNLDMVGRLRENRLTVQAMGSASVWPSIVERANVPGGFDLALSDDPWLPTDSSAFNAAGIPTLNLFTGTHPDYHRPSDTPDRLNYPGLARVARFAGLVARRVAAIDPPPEFLRVERAAADTPARASMSVYTGTIPEYATEIEGLLLGGVMEGGPAEKAGLRKGDVIVEFGGAAILTIYDYMGALEAVRIGEPVTVTFLRDGERHTVTLVPTARP